MSIYRLELHFSDSAPDAICEEKPLPKEPFEWQVCLMSCGEVEKILHSGRASSIEIALKAGGAVYAQEAVRVREGTRPIAKPDSDPDAEALLAWQVQNLL